MEQKEINLVTIVIREKPKGKNVSKWTKETPEMVYKERIKDFNQDMYLLSRIKTILKLKETEKFIIKEIKIVKFLGYGNSES